MRLAVLGSTRGTHLPALVHALNEAETAKITLVLSNKPDALILEKAKTLGIASHYVDPAGLTREAYDASVSAKLYHNDIDAVVLLGYMRILSPAFVEVWKGRLINVHPSLLPKYAGLMDLAVHQAVLAANESETGCTVHEVIAEVDAGRVLVQKRCAVIPGESPENLKARVQALEVPALVEAIASLVRLNGHATNTQ